MRLRWIIAPVALMALTWEASGQVATGNAPATDHGASLPPISAGPRAALAGALSLLPPGIREPAEPDGRIWIGDHKDLSSGAHLVERIDNRSPRPGALEWLEVEYTVDPKLDERVRWVLKRGRVPLGHVIVMDPATGEVFSYVSTAPEMFPATRTYPTASLMKVVTAAAVLRNSPEAAEGDCRYVGSPYNLKTAYLKPPTTGGRVDSFWRSLAISNNQCFARLAVHDVGQAALLAEMRETGLLDAPAARHSPGRVEPIDDALDLGNLGSGLAGSFITPLAAARLAALLADGQLVRPYWIAQVRDSNGNVLAVPGHQEPQAVWSPELTRELRELMVGVTARGTAKSAFRDERGRPLLGSIRVSGKTGSLSGRNPTGRYEWFIGVAPAEAPSIAIAVVVVNGPNWWSKASSIAAFTLREVFCERGRCDPANAKRLHARARARRPRAGPETHEEDLARAETTPLREVTVLDETPKPIGVSGFDFPHHLLQHKANGEIVLFVRLNPDGEVMDVEIDSSDLPEFNEFVVSEVRGWRFTPPRQQGHPVEAQARLPIPIDVD